jgi:acetyl esterase
LNGDSTLEEKYTAILGGRAATDKLVKQASLPDTLFNKLEVFGDLDNLKVSTTIFRPVGSENEVLPVILYW